MTKSLSYSDRLSHGPRHVARGLIPSTWETDGNRGGLHDLDTSLPQLVWSFEDGEDGHLGDLDDGLAPGEGLLNKDI